MQVSDKNFCSGKWHTVFCAQNAKILIKIMSNLKEKRDLLPVTVMEGVTVNVVPDEKFEFLLSTRDVAAGYGVSMYAIRMVKMRYADEFVEGKHFLGSVTICHAASTGACKGTMWTKTGIVRLGFFIKSARAKLFRGWAEELIIRLDEQRDLFGSEIVRPVVALPAKVKRNHNRLTADRMVRILADVARTENGELRMRLVNELMGRAE